MSGLRDFNPRSSCEERLLPKRHRCSVDIFQSTLLMRGATVAVTVNVKSLISIHAPHARSDIRDSYEYVMTKNFNPRSSCEERRRQQGPRSIQQDFNPRSSCEERHGLLGPVRLSKYFNPRSSCEERRHRRRDRCREAISIHAPHARSD